MEQKSYFFKLPYDDELYEIPSNLEIFHHINPNIRKELEDKNRYSIKSFVKKESLNLFIKYLKYQIKPDISNSNKSDLFLLYKEFDIFDKFLLNEKYYYYLKELQKQSDTDDQQIQDANAQNLDQILGAIAQNLDPILELYENELFAIPIKLLNLIFTHPKKRITNHNLCYLLILKHYQQNNNDKGILILLQYLDGCKLNKDNLKDAISNRSLRYNYMPKINYQYIRELNDQFNQFQEKQTEINNKIQEDIDSEVINHRNDDTVNMQIESEIETIQEQFETKLFQQNQSNQNKINELEKQMDILKNQNNEFESYSETAYNISDIYIEIPSNNDTCNIILHFRSMTSETIEYNLELKSLKYDEEFFEKTSCKYYYFSNKLISHYRPKICQYGFIIHKINDEIYYFVVFGNDYGECDDSFYSLFEFEVDFHQKCVDLSPNSIIDEQDDMYSWTQSENLLIYAKWRSFVTKFSNPRSIFSLYLVSDRVYISSILKIYLYLMKFDIKEISGIFIGGECLLSDKSLDFLMEKLDEIKKAHETNNNKTIIKKTSDSLNIITGIYCSNSCFTCGNNISIENHGVFYCDTFSANTKSTFNCLSGDQLIKQLIGDKNITLILGQNARMNIFKCSVKIDYFAAYSNSKIFVENYRDGNVEELRKIINNGKIIYKHQGFSQNCNEISSIFLKALTYQNDDDKNKRKFIKFGKKKLHFKKFPLK